MNIKRLSSEKSFIIIIVSAIFIFNLLPYLYQYQHRPPDKIYVGAFPIFLDKATYLATMSQGEAGHWTMIDQYTSEPQERVFLYPLYLLLGHLARVFGLSAETVFLVSRFFFGLALIFTIIYFIRYFVRDETQRKIAYSLAFFSSGLGWLVLRGSSIDRWLSDAIPMVRFSYFPHFSLATSLLLLAILLFYHSFKSKNGTIFTIVAGICAFILNLVLPFTSLLLYFLVGLFLLIILLKNCAVIKNNLKNILIFFIVALPSLFYVVYLGTSDSIWKTVEAQNILPAPRLLDLIIGYGLILVFSLFGFWALFRRRSQEDLFFIGWVLGLFILVFIPTSIYPMSRRFLETGVYLPLAITASFGLVKIYYFLQQKRIKGWCFSLVYNLSALIAVLLVAGNLQSWIDFKPLISRQDDPRFYLPKENIEAMRWLSNYSSSDSIVLSSLSTGNVIPYYAKRTVYVGHGPMTISLDEKLKKVEGFYSGKYSAEEAVRFLKQERINYIFYSAEEKKLNKFNLETNGTQNILNLEGQLFLQEVYQNSKATVFKVL